MAPSTIHSMTAVDKIGEALKRSLPLLPVEARTEVAKLLEPETLALVASTIAVWAGSHLVGVGEVVDIILLALGAAFLGAAAWDAARELVTFGTTAVNAVTSPDLDRAAHSFARAVNIIGINAVMIILARRPAKAVVQRGIPKNIKPGLLKVPPPPKGKVKMITRDPNLPSGYGATSMYGEIEISSAGSATDKAVVLYHELMHSFLSPKIAPLRQFRAELKWSAYKRSALMRYLEEALAETYAQLRVNGITALPTGIKFPVATGQMEIIYVSAAQLATEGAAVGSIVIGTMSFNVVFRPADRQNAK